TLPATERMLRGPSSPLSSELEESRTTPSAPERMPPPPTNRSLRPRSVVTTRWSGAVCLGSSSAEVDRAEGRAPEPGSTRAAASGLRLVRVGGSCQLLPPEGGLFWLAPGVVQRDDPRRGGAEVLLPTGGEVGLERNQALVTPDQVSLGLGIVLRAGQGRTELAH